MELSQNLILIGVNSVLAIAGFVIAFIISRLTRSIDSLQAADERLEAKMLAHREDTLKNFATANDIKGLKDDISDRLDRFESTILAVVGRRDTDRGPNA